MKINKLNTSFKDPVISSLDQLDQIKLPDTNKAVNNKITSPDDLNLDYKYVTLDTAGKEIAWLLGAYIRGGSRTSSTSFKIPHSLHNPTLNSTQTRGTHYTLLNLFELGFSKDLSPGPGIQWVENKELVHEFLKGFTLGDKEHHYSTKSDIHIPLIFKWLNRHGFDPILHSPTFISWTPNHPLHPIPTTLGPGKHWIGKKLKKPLNPDNDPEIEEKLDRMKYLIIKEEEL